MSNRADHITHATAEPLDPSQLAAATGGHHHHHHHHGHHHHHRRPSCWPFCGRAVPAIAITYRWY